MFRSCDARWTRVKTCTSEMIKVDDATKREGWSVKELLEQACLRRNMYIVEKILKQETVCDTNIYLKYACKGGHLDIVNLLIERGATWWNDGLYYACFGGHLDLAMLMIERGACRWNDGLRGACEGGHSDLVTFMIERGA